MDSPSSSRRNDQQYEPCYHAPAEDGDRQDQEGNAADHHRDAAKPMPLLASINTGAAGTQSYACGRTKHITHVL